MSNIDDEALASTGIDLSKPWDKNFDEVIGWIRRCAGHVGFTDEWTWPRNSNCKYVEIRIDMRDGAFILKDRHGARISLEDLLKQSGKPWPNE